MPRHHLVTNGSIYSVRPVVTQHHVQVIAEAKPPKSEELGPFEEVSIYTARPVITRHHVQVIVETPHRCGERSLIYYVLMSVALTLWLPPLLAVGGMISGTAVPACILIWCAISFVAGTLIGNFALCFEPRR